MFERLRVGLFRNRSKLYSLAAIGGVALTAALSFKAGEETEKSRHEEPTNYKKLTGLYFSAFALGAGTIFCILKSGAVSQQQIRNLEVGYTALRACMGKFENAVDEEFGEGTSEGIKEKLRNNVEEGRYTFSRDLLGNPNYIPYGSEKVFRWREPHTGQYFLDSSMNVRNAQYHFNRNYSLRGGEASIAEFLEFLNLDISEEDKDWGWSCEYMDDYGYTWIDFTTAVKRDKDGLYYEIQYVIPPIKDYNNWS